MRWKPRTLVVGVSLGFLLNSSPAAIAQTSLPEVQVNPPPAATPQRKTKRGAKSKVAASRQGKTAAVPGPASAGAAPKASSSGARSQGGQGGPSPALVAQTQMLDAARAQIFAPFGTNTFSMSSTDISNLPAGQDTPFDKVLLQAPGFSQDSAARTSAARTPMAPSSSPNSEPDRSRQGRSSSCSTVSSPTRT